MWFSALAGSKEPHGCESGSGNTDVEGSSPLKDSTGWEACSDWSDWNLPEKTQGGNGAGRLTQRAIWFV